MGRPKLEHITTSRRNIDSNRRCANLRSTISAKRRTHRVRCAVKAVGADSIRNQPLPCHIQLKHVTPGLISNMSGFLRLRPNGNPVDSRLPTCRHTRFRIRVKWWPGKPTEILENKIKKVVCIMTPQAWCTFGREKQASQAR